MSDGLCAFCGKPHGKCAGAVNRAASIGAPLYCDRVCAGLGRRKHKPDEQKKAEKRAYDAARRVEIADRLKAEKAAYHKRTYDPVKAAVERKKRSPLHVAYCRRPEYRAWKREYDRQHRAKTEYGEWWECFLLTEDIRDEALAQSSDYEIRRANGTLNKITQRKRAYERFKNLGIDGEEHEVGPLGNLECGQKRGHAARAG